MRFAVRLPSSNRIASRSAVVDVAQAAEELGFYALSVHDHVVFNGWWVACGARDGEGSGDDRDMYEALTTLSFVAGRTRRVKLLTAILLVPARETVLMAKQLATLDVLSEGRLLLGVGIGPQVTHEGVGAGNNEVRLGAHGVNAVKEYETFRVPRQRGKMADEQLAAMRQIWTEDKPSYAGQFVQFNEIEVFPKPVQPGGPPIWVGGRSPAAMRRLLEFGEGWLPNSLSPDQYAEGVAKLKDLAAARGRPAPAGYGLNIFATLGESDADALAIFQPTIGRQFSPEALLAGNLVGSPDTVRRRVEEYAAVGVNLLELKPIYRSVPQLIGMMERIARDIMPAVPD